MKKYIKPQIEVSNIELSSIICASDVPGIESNIAPQLSSRRKRSFQRISLSMMIGVTKNNSPYAIWS